MAKKPRCTNALEIEAYLHCGRCLDELPAGQSPGQWARTSVGWTRHGLQLWCDRHEVNICNIDFEGQTHPARTDP